MGEGDSIIDVDEGIDLGQAAPPGEHILDQPLD